MATLSFTTFDLVEKGNTKPMTTANAYANARFVVETNARKQAIGDAYATPLYKIREYLANPNAMMDVIEILDSWATGDNANLVFSGLPKEDYDALFDSEKRSLIKFWCYLYPVIVLDLLSRRLSEESNDSKTY